MLISKIIALCIDRLVGLQPGETFDRQKRSRLRMAIYISWVLISIILTTFYLFIFEILNPVTAVLLLLSIPSLMALSVLRAYKRPYFNPFKGMHVIGAVIFIVCIFALSASELIALPLTIVLATLPLIAIALIQDVMILKACEQLDAQSDINP